MASARAIGLLAAGLAVSVIGLAWAMQRERNERAVREAAAARTEALRVEADERAARERIRTLLEREAAAMQVGEVKEVSLESVTLMPPLMIGREEVRRVRMKGKLGGKGVLELDPNPAVVDAWGNVSKVGGRYVTPVEVELAAGEGNAEGWRSWEIRPVAGTGSPAWVGSVVLRLTAREGKGGVCGVMRLVVSEPPPPSPTPAPTRPAPPTPGAVVRVVTMEVREE